MKKKYITPVLKKHHFTPANILSDSTVGYSGDNDEVVNPTADAKSHYFEYNEEWN